MSALFRALSVFAVLTFVASCTKTDRSAAEIVPAVAPAKLVQERPRLFFRKGDLPRIRETIAAIPEAKKQYDMIVGLVDPGREVRFPTPGKPTQPDWQRVVQGESAHAARCAFLYQLTGEAKYAAWAKKMLLAYAAEFDTRVNFELCSDFSNHEPGHKGNAGNTMGFYHSGYVLMNLAMAYDSIHETLSPGERSTIENGFFRKYVAVIERFDYATRVPRFASDFMVAGGQWNGANLCNMGLTAVGFALHDPHLYNRGIRNFKFHLGRDLLSDGFWVEEDRNYSDTCMLSLFNIAWMARTAGYPEDLFATTVHAKPAGEYDLRYAESVVPEDGPHRSPRNLAMYLDAHLDYQYPTLANGNWGWMPNRGSATRGDQLLGMYTIGYAVYDKPAYAFILQNADRSKALLGAGVTSLMYFGKPVEQIPPPGTKSRVYSHGRWVALKSIEGPGYWKSDATYAFMPYSIQRTKPLQAFSLDIFAFGKVLAPRVGLKHQAQSLTTDYQLTEPAWNNVHTDGRNASLMKERPDRAWMAWQDLGPLVKIVSPRIHYIGGRQSELYQPIIERHPEEDRTVSRTLAMTDRYLVDIYHVTYDREPLYHHNFDYILHGYGKLGLEGIKDDRDRFSPVTAVWKQEDGVGLRSTMLPSTLGSGTKFKTYASPATKDAPGTEFFVGSRAGHEMTFLVVHEPVKGESRLKTIRKVAEGSDHVAVEITHGDGTVDVLAVRLKDTKSVHAISGVREGLAGNYLFVRKAADGSIRRQQ